MGAGSLRSAMRWGAHGHAHGHTGTRTRARARGRTRGHAHAGSPDAKGRCGSPATTFVVRGCLFCGNGRDCVRGDEVSFLYDGGCWGDRVFRDGGGKRSFGVGVR